MTGSLQIKLLQKYRTFPNRQPLAKLSHSSTAIDELRVTIFVKPPVGCIVHAFITLPRGPRCHRWYDIPASSPTATSGLAEREEPLRQIRQRLPTRKFHVNLPQSSLPTIIAQ
jgi:hypothetical protein